MRQLAGGDAGTVGCHVAFFVSEFATYDVAGRLVTADFFGQVIFCFRNATNRYICTCVTIFYIVVLSY